MEGVLIIISLCCIISLGYEYSGISDVSRNGAYTRTVGSDKYLRNTTLKLKTILLWDKFSYLPDYDFGGTGQKPFQKYGCSVNNCFITNRDVEQLDRPVEDYDVVLFHMYNTKLLPLPRQRKLHQRYVILLMESPQSVIMQTDYKDYFNWTMSYRRDSDIWWPYGSLISRLSSMEEDPRSVNFHLIQPQFDTNKSSVFDLSQKKYLMAWFVSRCITFGGRELYVNELKKYIPIHIYGICGNYSCSRANKSACLELLERNYKFYLSFENSVCKDYVTEKLFDVIRYNVVPIVYGGANYSEILPPMSYINVADFSTPQDLANYLLYLDKTPEEYAKYFWWKSYYRFQEPKVMCKLCEMLHNSSLPYKVYHDIRGWWEGGGICKTHRENTWIRDFGGLLSPWIKQGNNRHHKNETHLKTQVLISSAPTMIMFICCVFILMFILLESILFSTVDAQR